jgi:hypothetical protein
MFFKKVIRNIAIKLNSITSGWVVSTDVYKLIDNDDFDVAEKILTEQTKIWGSDPEIIRAQSLIKCFK